MVQIEYSTAATDRSRRLGSDGLRRLVCLGAVREPDRAGGWLEADLGLELLEPVRLREPLDDFVERVLAGDLVAMLGRVLAGSDKAG
jgi:hypothetical protein